jgi:hypothetical protein
MDPLSLGVDLLAGWCLWSLGHNLGHRWWHDDMKKGIETFYAHGEREHHRIYDAYNELMKQQTEDPKELFISFPFPVVALMAIVPVAAYALLRGWVHAVPFAAAVYACMALDHRLHILFHRSGPLRGILGRLQEMHIVHHATHNRNFFFVTGYIWDVLFKTAVRKRSEAHP